MSRTSQPPPSRAPVHAVHVLGAECAVACAHVRALAEGLGAHGLRVTVCVTGGDATAGAAFAGSGARCVPALGSGPESLAELRAVCADADVVHAHGPRAAMRTALAMAGPGRGPGCGRGWDPDGGRDGVRRAPPLVVSWHTREHAAGAARSALLAMLERRAVRAAAVVLGATSALVDRARRHGARDARLAPTALPGVLAPPDATPPHPEHGPKTRAEIGAVDRPLLLTVGPLDRHQGHRAALTAARGWTGLEPPPLLAIAGEGPLRAALQARIEAEELPVRLLGRRDDALDLVALADLALVTARWPQPSLAAQQALRAGVPLVATASDELAELVGDAAVLVPYGDAEALDAAVSGLLADPSRRAALAAAGRARAVSRPTEDDMVAYVLSTYDELLQDTA